MQLTEQELLKRYEPVSREAALRTVNHALWNKHNLRRCQSIQARATPLPGPSLEAFTSGPIEAAGKLVHEVRPIHLILLQKLQHPLLDAIQKAIQTGKMDINLETEHELQLCYLFTADPQELYANRKDIEKVKEACDKITMEWEAAAIRPVVLAILEQYIRHIKTAVKFTSDLSEAGQVTFFQDTPTTQKPMESGSSSNTPPVIAGS